MNEIAVIIPAYKPHEKIMNDFMEELKRNFKNIVIVDDGSGKEYEPFFKKFEEMNIPVLRHHVNMGKGRAIKTAFNYCLNTYPHLLGTITADCDGQHTVSDITKCIEKLKENPQKLVIGTRNFDAENVPFKSRYGNKITRNMFTAFIGIKITDTQSGLRAFGVDAMKEFLTIAGERYEYETNMLIACKEHEIEIAEVPIDTIYINNNELSHFHPFRDAFLIYKLFLKYVLAAVSSFFVDILLFSLFMHILPNINLGILTTIVIATILARIFSSTYNFTINAKVVFKNKGKNSMIKYFTLVVIQMFISAFLVSEIFKATNLNSITLKIGVDILIFIANFIIQREWVFKNKK